MSFLNLGVKGLKAGITLGYSQNKQGDGLKSMCNGVWDCVGGQDLRGDKQKYCIYYNKLLHTLLHK